MKTKGKKGQFILFTTLFLFFLFFATVTFFFEYILVDTNISGEEYKLLQQETTRVADALLLPGYPQGWNNENVQRIGLTNQGYLNKTKLGALKEMNEERYEDTKTLLGVQNNYLIILKESNNIIEVIGLFESEEQLVGSQARAISTQERIIPLMENNEAKTVKMKVYTYIK